MKTLTAFYDLKVGPVSFDVLAFLVQAEIERRRIGADALHVVVLPYSDGVAGKFRDKLALYDADEMDWRLWNIVIPACRLIGATVTLAQDKAHGERIHSGLSWPPEWWQQSTKRAHHHAREIIAAARNGEDVPRLSASAHALRKVNAVYQQFGKPVITLTRRNTYDAARNSDPAAWDALKQHAQASGFAVVNIFDTEVALQNGGGFGELNLDLRMACYQLAAMNWHANGGPSALCWYSHCKFVHVGAAWPRDPWVKHYEWLGLEYGQQLPWATPEQQLLYEPGNRTQLLASFDAWMHLHKKAA